MSGPLSGVQSFDLPNRPDTPGYLVRKRAAGHETCGAWAGGREASESSYLRELNPNPVPRALIPGASSGADVVDLPVFDLRVFGPVAGLGRFHAGNQTFRQVAVSSSDIHQAPAMRVAHYSVRAARPGR